MPASRGSGGDGAKELGLRTWLNLVLEIVRKKRGPVFLAIRLIFGTGPMSQKRFACHGDNRSLSRFQPSNSADVKKTLSGPLATDVGATAST
jgi:hypothetical protein